MIYKRGTAKKKWYWMDVTVDGIRYRQPLKTPNWQKAKQEEKRLIQQAAAGLLSRKTEGFARLGFTEAADQYLEGRKTEIADSSYKKEKQLLAQPKEFFGSIRVRKIEAQNLLDYRAKRVSSGVGPVIVNMEMSVIGRLLKKARRWHLVAAEIKPLKQAVSSVGRALQPEQKKKLLEIAASKAEWLVVRCAAELALNTTMRGCELKHLRWKNVSFGERLLHLERSKTQAGLRTIPLNKSALKALSDLWERAKELGSTDAKHYVFPACENGHFDATKPQKSWRTSWRKLTNEAGVPGLRFHDLRHHAITELAESKASDQTILSIAGHVSRRMLDHYSHVRLQAKKEALDWLIEGKPKRKKEEATKSVQLRSEESYVTNHVTNVPPEELPHPQAIQNIMGATGIEPMTSTVSRWLGLSILLIRLGALCSVLVQTT